MRTGTFVWLFTFVCLICSMNEAAAAEDLTASASNSALGARAHRGGGTVTILRGTPRQPASTEADNTGSKPQIVRAGVIGTGNNLWYVDSDQRIHACWLSGTGYVNSLKVVCTR